MDAMDGIECNQTLKVIDTINFNKIFDSNFINAINKLSIFFVRYYVKSTWFIIGSGQTDLIINSQVTF